MSANPGGFIVYRKERYLFDDATASWHEDGDLFVFAKSHDSAIYFCAIPFGSADNLAGIKGREYEEGGGCPFVEGKLVVGGYPFYMDGGRITCIGVSPAMDAVAIEFDLVVQSELSRSKKPLRGGMRCRIVNDFNPDFGELDF